MADVRTLLAALLGAVLGLVMVLAPEFVVQVHTVGRRPHEGRGEYGGERDVPDQWRRLVQAAGVALILLGGYFGYTLI